MLKFKIHRTKIPSNINIICPTINEIFCYLRDAYGVISEDIEFEIKVVLNELILNAIKHGNKENSNKYVKIAVAINSENQLLLIIEDEGQGYNSDCLLENTICSIEDIDLCEMKVSGRGLMIVKNLCDKVKINKKGNRIIILKKLFSQ